MSNLTVLDKRKKNCRGEYLTFGNMSHFFLFDSFQSQTLLWKCVHFLYFISFHKSHLHDSSPVWIIPKYEMSWHDNKTCDKWRLRSACAAGQSDQSSQITCLLQPAGYPYKWEPLPYLVDVQADPSLCWSHRSYCRFYCALAQIILQGT